MFWPWDWPAPPLEPFTLAFFFGDHICDQKFNHHNILTLLVIDDGGDYNSVQEGGWICYVLFWYGLSLISTIHGRETFDVGVAFLLYGNHWLQIPLPIQCCKLLCLLGNESLEYMDLVDLLAYFLPFSLGIILVLL